MNQATHCVFANLPRSARGHFAILFYAAVYRLLYYIHQLEDFGGETLEETFKRYPFLDRYFTEMRQQMPQALSWREGIAWWRSETKRWEAQTREHLPLRILTERMGVGFDARLVLLLTGLNEQDSRFGTLFAELQAPLNQRRPTLELIGRILKDADSGIGASDAWALCRPLLANGLVETLNNKAPRAEWALQVPAPLWDAILGQTEAEPLPGCHYFPAATFPSFDELIFPADFLQRLKQVPGLIETGRVRILLLRSDPGAQPQQILGVIAGALGLGLLSIDLTAVNVKQNEQSWRSIAALCLLNSCLPVVKYKLGPGETATLPALPGYSGPIAVTLGEEGGLDSHSVEKILTLSLPLSDSGLRKRQWRQVLDGHSGDDLDMIAEAFHLSEGYIGQVARMAIAHAGLEGRKTVRLEDVRAASRALNRQPLDTLAARLEACGSWDDLSVADATAEKLTELSQRCFWRERLLDKLGPAFSGNSNRGVRALFTGVSGTGKTLAAKILAAELGMDLYRVDLAAVVNKYIGETEKNLHQVLSHAEALDVVLLLDEGDALLGSRTQVKSANDRYANIETNYLLQRLENYQGIVLVTTNLAENIDRAFQRRMDIVVPFFAPQLEQRWRILQRHLPLDHAVDSAYLDKAAQRCNLSGGQLRNVAQHAALLALEEHSPVTNYHFGQALRSEYRKIGGTYPLASVDPKAAEYNDDGMSAFVAALRERAG